MKFDITPKPKHKYNIGDQRIIKSTAWWPKIIDPTDKENKRYFVWLSNYATVVQFRKFGTGTDGYRWVDMSIHLNEKSAEKYNSEQFFINYPAKMSHEYKTLPIKNDFLTIGTLAAILFWVMVAVLSLSFFIGLILFNKINHY